MFHFGRTVEKLSPLAKNTFRSGTKKLGSLLQVPQRDIHYETAALRQHVENARAKSAELNELLTRHETFEKQYPKLDELRIQFGNTNTYQPRQHQVTILQGSLTPVSDLTHEVRHGHDKQIADTLDPYDTKSMIQGEFEAIASQRKAADQANEPYRQIMKMPDADVMAHYEKIYGKAPANATFTKGKSLT
ncbi:hypothetical protein [Burkholderia perseverans]|uniref:hypothetical protein n=1 Tax=Burkholderia perseverans TaxID=2615214 RepID=UPI001FF01CAD|nr:hypothetical protein [Burkholderia perseverans]